MRTWHRVGLLLLVAVSLLTWSCLSEQCRAVAGPALGRRAARVEPEAVVVSVHPPDQKVRLGDQFSIAVEVTGLASPLSAFQFDLGYDPALLRPVGTTPGAFLASTGRTIICPEPAYPTPGTVRLACAGAGGEPGPAGSDSLATLAFTALVTGTSPLTLSAVQLPGGGIPPAAVDATAQGGQVTVIAPPEVWGIYLPLVLKAH